MGLEDRFDEFLSEYRENRDADTRFQGKIEQVLFTHQERINDHGQRLRSLERFRNWAAGVGAGVLALISWPRIRLGD